MLFISAAGAVEPLADSLAEVLAQPLDDPLASDWIAVPTAGMRRWLSLHLARSLGASSPGAGDGIAANITFTFPGALRQVIVAAGSPGMASDPWHVDHLVWAVLEVLQHRRGDSSLGPVGSLAPGATWYGRARRLADLFDHYAVRRPELLVRWQDGNDVDPNGRPLPVHQLWQPYLWRLVRARVGQPSPAERLPSLLAELRTEAGAGSVDLPSRLAVFGITSIPGGMPLLTMAHALATHRDVHLFFLDPSPTASSKVTAHSDGVQLNPHLRRGSDTSAAVVDHPLLRSWGRPSRERAVQLAAAKRLGLPAVRWETSPGPATSTTPATLLGQIQDDLTYDHAPAGTFRPAPDDCSVTIHTCHGPARQVEVLRDAIMHLLADDASLGEEDIVVLCPALGRFAPLIEAGFGPPAPATQGRPNRLVSAVPRLRYHITDRSLRVTFPIAAAFASLLDLVSGRCTVTELLEFVALAPVRHRFGFDDDDLATITAWAAASEVRWGLDPIHRRQWGIPPALVANSWQSARQRLLTGVAVASDSFGLAPGDIVPLDVEGDDVAVAGRFADVVARLSALAVDLGDPRSPAQWSDTLIDLVDQFLAVDPSQQWQHQHLHGVLTGIGDNATIGDDPPAVELTLADVRRLLADHLQAKPSLHGFFTGGITISSPTPLRALPFRVVCILGLDDGPSGAGGDPADGDDLTTQTPLVGDHDPRTDLRESLLFALLAARDHLIVTRTGRDVRTNQPVPASVTFAELQDTIAATLDPSVRTACWDQIETTHPRQGFDARCFTPGALGHRCPWSFDSAALAGARARAQRLTTSTAVPSPWPSPVAAETADAAHAVVTVDELQRFLRQPVRFFLRNRLGIHLPAPDRLLRDDLPVTRDPLLAWAAGSRLIAARLSGCSDAQWAQYEMALGSLPPGGIGNEVTEELIATVDAIVDSATRLGLDLGRRDRYPIDVALDDGTRIVGVVQGTSGPGFEGPTTVTFSSVADKHRLAAWLDLLVLVAADPARAWQATVVGKARNGSQPKAAAMQLVPAGASPDQRRSAALAGLAVAVDCYRRGQVEPVPLFPTLSPLLYRGTAQPANWRNYDTSGDGDDEATRIAFGDLDWEHLYQLPSRPHDPPGSSALRVERYARYLWSAVEASVEDRR